MDARPARSSGGLSMPLIAYVQRRFAASTLEIIDAANAIIDEYQAAGYMLTLRQLYYQFVARDLLPNEPREYDRLGSIVNDARLAGMIDWSAIEDRTRELTERPTWGGPQEIVRASGDQYRRDLWEDQHDRVEVWIEKEALAGVFERVCEEERIPYFSCRGYTSQSAMWAAAQRMLTYIEQGQEVVILHFGDHDPSGIDMSRDIRDRLAMFGADVLVKRLALNMSQVRHYNPPPNPAKVKDSRYDRYVARFGNQSWELDALEPDVLAGMVKAEASLFRDDDLWARALAQEALERRDIIEAARRWRDVSKLMRRGKP